MRARILPTDDFAEFGKANTVILLLSINPTEAALLLDGLEGGESTVSRMLYGHLQIIAENGLRRSADRDQDAVNTDGRSLRTVPSIPLKAQIGLHDAQPDLED